MSDLNLDTLHALKRLGVGFSIWIPSSGGVGEYHATVEDLLLLEDDAEKLYAKAHGLTVEQFRDWHDQECSIICSATTKAGNRCSNYVKGGYQVSASVYLQRNGEKCSSHGG